MIIESVDFFYLSMPVIHDIGDGSQDALLVRIQAGGYDGWGECEAAPLVSIASWSCPMSHSACKPIKASVIGQKIDSVEDIGRINATVRENSMDLLQTSHTLSGIDIAMWDLLGKKQERPVYQMLGYKKAYPKTPYASQLFCNDPQETYQKSCQAAADGYSAVKFGWGPYGRGSVEEDEEQVQAAREGLGKDGILLVDAGTVWGDNVEQARSRLPALARCRVGWLEEPFVGEAYESYRTLAKNENGIRIAGGEGCNNFYQGKAMVDYAKISYLQIDSGRVGGIATSKQLADYAHSCQVNYVNHTFTTQLALSASLASFAGIEDNSLCEYPVCPSVLAIELTSDKLMCDDDKIVRIPEAPGLGIEPNLDAIRKYLVDVEIRVDGKAVYQTPNLV